MKKIINRISSPNDLDSNWDNLADFYFQKREFLNHLHKYNPCDQRYYELYRDNLLVVGTLVYTLRINIFTFANIPSKAKVTVIGLPVSIASPPVIGDPGEFEYLLSELIKIESGLILGINFVEDYLKGKVLNLRTLPTIVLNLNFNSIENYENSLRHSYRRRIHKIKEEFRDVTSVTTDCSVFSKQHYDLYVQIMNRTTTKLETLSLSFFKYLPDNFQLTTYHNNGQMLCWNIVCKDEHIIFFFFGGMDYSLRDKYQSYHNNLFSIIESAINLKYNTLDFGQTAEIAKTRFGGKKIERRMFVYHKNFLIFALFKIFRNLITYSKTTESSRVFKD
jgi:hypothetical protein